jgi:glycosyltransferase involved in cell wall biosynthesis
VVSIVTPYHNDGPVVLDTVRSVQQQSLQQWELLIVNDCSDDPEALEVLDGLRGTDPRIRILDQPTNRGLAASRNAGVQHARAEYVFFLDADDLLEPTTLEKTTWCLESYPEFSFSKGVTVHFEAEQYYTVGGFESRELFLSQNPITPRALARREVVLAVGGFDEATKWPGLEDWEFWVRSAAHGYWGRTIPEFLDWYRRRADHSQRWPAWSIGGEESLRQEFRHKYPELYAGGFPDIQPRPWRPYEPVPEALPYANLLTKTQKRILLIIPWMAMGGADKFTLDLIDQLQRQRYEVTVATTLKESYGWYQEYAARTPDLFILPHFLRPTDYPRFLHYLIRSRHFDVVMVTQSELGYRLLPYLRSRCPDTAFVDYCHMEEEYWNSGGHPRQAVAYQDHLDLNVVSSQHLKDWMVSKGAEPSQIEVCYTNVDTESLRPDPVLREKVRRQLEIPPGLPVLLFAGRFTPQKQPQVLAAVLRELRVRGLDFRCLIAGDGEYRKWLARYLRRHRLGRHVRMVGTVSNQRVRELLGASDILFLPSMMEGISLTIYDAMALGVVPVSANVGGQSELVTSDCGVLVDRRAEQEEVLAYADVLEELISSPERREALGRSARERVVSGFRLEQMGSRMEELLVRAQARHAAGSKPETSLRLGTEHAVQAMEYLRLAQAAGGLWKYQGLEAWRRKLLGRMWPWVGRARGFALHAVRPLRSAKDALWIAGHRFRVRLSGRGAPE